MSRPEPTTVVTLLKDCIHGPAGKRLRMPYREAIKACEKGMARLYEWKPPTRKVVVDVQKGAPHGP